MAFVVNELVLRAVETKMILEDLLDRYKQAFQVLQTRLQSQEAVKVEQEQPAAVPTMLPAERSGRPPTADARTDMNPACGAAAAKEAHAAAAKQAGD